MLRKGEEGGSGGGGGVGKASDGRTLVYLTHGAASPPNFTFDLQQRYESVNSTLPTILLLRDPAR